jgi:hypothetical protein
MDSITQDIITALACALPLAVAGIIALGIGLYVWLMPRRPVRPDYNYPYCGPDAPTPTHVYLFDDERTQ